MMMTRIRSLAAAVIATILLGSCGGEPTGPGVGMGQVALAPVFASATEASIVDVAFVRVRINEALRTDALIDTVIAWPATGDSLVIRLALPVTTEPYALRLAMANAQGDTVFRAGPTPVRATFNPRPDDVASPVLTYIGVGSNATGVRFVSPPVTATFGQTVAITAEAFDGQNTVIAGTPIAFSLVNPADSVRARFPDRGVGSLVVGSVRGNVAIEARLLTGPSVTTTIAVQPVANGIVVQSGNTQSGTAGGALAQPFVARVRAADGLGVAGVPVAFSVLTGGGTLSTVIDTSDANGDVSSTLTLGLVAGAQTVRASVPSVPGAEVIFTANAVGGAATRLVILDEPNNTTAGTPVAAVVRVAIQDAGGNLVTTATDAVAAAILNNPGGAGVLQGPASVNAVAGIATFTGLRIDQAAAGYTLRFTSGALASDTSQAFTVAPAAATALAFATQPPLTAVNNTPFTVAVRARDAFGNTVPTFTAAVSVAIGTNPSAGTLAGTTSVAAVAGVATFTNLSINNIGSGYTLGATGGALTAATSNAFDITASAGVNAWTNVAGGNWSTATNWSQGSVPDPGDTVTIELPGTYTVTLDVPTTVGRLRIGAASGTQTLLVSGGALTMAESVFVATRGVLSLAAAGLTGAGSLQVDGALNWTGGNITGVGGLVRIRPGGTLTASGAANRNFGDRTLEIAGAATWSATGLLNTGLGAVLRVAPGGSLTVSSDGAFTNTLGGAAPLLHNQGTFTRNTATATFDLFMPWENDGATSVQSGLVRFSGGSGAGTSGGSLAVAAGATVSFIGGSYTLDAASSTSGTGTFTVAGGTVAINSAFTHPGPVTVSGGSLLLGGATNSLTGFTLSSGTFGGAVGSTTTLAGTTTWTGGSIENAGTVRIPVGATLTANTANPRTLANGTLEILGTANLLDSYTMNTGQGSVLRVGAGGALNLQGDHIISYNLGGAASRLHNLGTVTRVSGTGFSTMSLPTDNDGTWVVSTGGQRFNGGSDIESWSGALSVATGASAEFSFGTTALGPTATVSGTGAVNVNGGTVNVAGPLNFTGAMDVSAGAINFNAAATLSNVSLSGGTIGGTATITVNPTFSWTGGELVGTGGLTIPVGATLTSSGTTTRGHSGRLLSVAGTATFTGAHQINTGLGSILRVQAGGTMLVQGPHSFLNNLGGAAPLIENLGTLTKNTSAGTLNFGTPFTSSGTITISTGQIDIAGNSTLGGPIAIAAASILRFNGGTSTLLPTLVVSGLGETVVNVGTVGGLVAGDTANFARLRLLTGVLAHGGVIRSSDYLEWAGGTAVNGSGVLVAVDTFQVTGTVARQLTNGTIETYGVTRWASTATINSGQGARWRNMPTGDMEWSGNGSFLNNLGGVAATLENRGTLRFAGTGTTTVSAAIVDTVGVAFNVLSGTVVAGGGGRLGGSKTVNGFLDVTGGTLTMRPATSIASTTGALRIAGGTVTPDSGATVSIARLELNGGFLSHEATVTIGSLFNWTAGVLQSNTVGLGGTTTVGATATMNITGATARTASGTHLLNLLAGATVNHNATGGILTGQGFTVQNSGTYNLQNVGGWAFTLGGTQPTFRNLTGANVIANGASTGGFAMRLDNAGGALTVTTDSLRFLLGSTGSLTGTATVNAGALVLGGGPFTMTGALTIAGTAADLVIDNAALTVGAQTLTVNGDLLTRNGGSVVSATATGVVDVNGNATFNGGQSVLSAGTLRVAGNFTQGPTGVSNAFDASGTHRTVFDGAGAQSITFANPTTSRFNRVEFPAITHTATLQTNATVLDSLIMLGGAGATDLVGAGTTQRLTVNGVLRMDFSTLSPSLTVPVVEISAVPAVAAISSPGRGFSPDTAVYLGGAITALPTNAGYKYKSVRLTTGAGVTVSSDTISNDLHTTSSLISYVGSVTHLIQGKLRTTGTGGLFLFSVDANVTVGDSAIFSGASTNGSLNAGTLTLRGNFVQAGGNTAAFSATGAHTTIFAGTGLQTIRFDNPGTSATTSHFAELRIGNNSLAGVRILSPVHAVTELSTPLPKLAISLVSSTTGDSLSAAGVDADSLTFDNVPVRITANQLNRFNVIRFQNMAPAATQLRYTRNAVGTASSPNLIDFASAPTTGFYFVLVNNTGSSMPFAFSNPTPATIGALNSRYQLLGASAVSATWGGQPMPQIP